MEFKGILSDHALHSQTRQLLRRVIDFARRERDAGELLVSLANVQERVCAMTGVSLRAISRICNEKIFKDQIECSTTTTQTKQQRKNVKDTNNKVKLNLEQFKTNSKTILKQGVTGSEHANDLKSEPNDEKFNNDLPVSNLQGVSGNKVKIKEEDSESTVITCSDIQSIIKEEVDEDLKPDTKKWAVENLKGRKATKRPHIDVEYDVTKIKIEKQESIEDDIKTDIKNEVLESKVQIKKDVKVPLNWDLMLNNLRQMRKNLNAPVDSMGCDQCMDDGANPVDQRYQALLSLMLSSQTKDVVTHAAMQRLIGHGCTLQNILNTSDEKLGELIYPVGFWKTKVKYIKKSSEMIRDQFGGDIPKTVKDLCKLNGVGPKMSHLCMKTAWGEVTGIGVDTHVHRISNRMGWVKSKTPEETRTQLEGWLPKELWSEVNHLLVGFGQQVCLPIKPSCSTCLNCKICPFARKARIKSEVEVKEELE